MVILHHRRKAFRSTSGASPAEETDPYFDNVVLLMHMNGTDGGTTFTDNSNSAHAISVVGNAQTSTSQSKFNGSSALFDGSGDKLSIPDSADFNLSGGDYTIEFFLRFSTVKSCSFVHQSSGLGEWAFFREGNVLYYQRRGGSQNVAAAWTPSSGVWYYIAITRSGSSTQIWVDGTSLVTSSNDPSMDTSKPLLIGGFSDLSSYDLNGNMAEMRITKGVARDVSNVPTAPFPDVGNPDVGIP